MPRRTLARRNALLTLASQPWTLYETDPNDQGAGGGGGGGTTVNEHGYPEATPVADMSAEHQAAYWRYHSKKWETTAKGAPDAAEVQRLKDRDAALKKIEDEKLTADERAAQERTALTQERDGATATVTSLTDENARLKVALDKGLTLAQAERLRGSTTEELEADADELKALFGGSGDGQGSGTPGGGTPRSGGNRGGDVGNTSTITSGAERYRARHGKQQ
ncbi:hypothetical protein [Streptomyces sp. NPDC060001]|uniref:hypothetical protein n=1 Tax=Streptomyces sp. NPDC060001 TaxID=3347032 RepID=UPI0036829EB4